MTVPPLLALMGFVLVATLSPGGATTLATASGANFGLRRSLPLIAGIAMGLASMAAAAAAGLAGLLLAAPALQVALKASGTAYLLWLAWQVGRRSAPRGPGGGARPQSFVDGLWMLWHNPKGWAMTMGAAASFAGLAEGPARLGLLLGAAFGVSAALSLSLWCCAGLVLGRSLRTTAQWRILNAALGSLLALSVLPIWL
ncbi:LysE family translocator [Lichenibacterium ramalinae]|uniref:LysE family translocator n=1 Tax=Lichenibacterium ramalinae TaxID=2316527 RepID=A0A4Q2RJ05_9HYPH|nr:LysE family transporter [Lichenibacterium ramalinae]RYB06971.1 LysE family translocator [Lichenibacterium ramalinae]